ncbi:unnamed protein product [Ostreobium quekettii]|uniref:Protein kinase domain-containing protein n=1 Tax=Ostreobium quekettii TaxID=121088 RepID=A0A8S1J061_9CHLO|nr:unnamed protein product [Ostreobium quekettii]
MGPVPRTTPDEPAATRRRTTLAAPFLLALLVSSSVQPTSGRDVPPRYRPVARDCHQLFSLLASSPQPRVISAEGRLDCDEDGGRVVVSKSATLQGAAAIDFGARIGAILLRPGVVMRMRELVLIRSEGGDDFAFVGSAGGPVAQLQLRDVAVVRGEGNGGGGTEASEPIFMGRGRGGPTLRSSSGPGCPGVVRLARNCTVQVNASGTVTGNCAPEGCDADGECLGGDRWDDRRLSALLEAAGFGACGILREGVLSAGLHASQTASVAAAGCLAVLLLLMWLGPKVLGAWGPRRAGLTRLRASSSADEVPAKDSCSIEGLSLGAIELRGLLGVGAAGRVYLGSFRGADVAVKVVDHDGEGLAVNEESLEARIGVEARHPNLVRTYVNETRGRQSVEVSLPQLGDGPPGEGEDPLADLGVRDALDPDDFGYLEGRRHGAGGPRTWIVTEFCDRGSLHGAIVDGLFFYDREKLVPRLSSVLLCAVDVVAALAYLHGRGVVHGDLRPENVLLKTDLSDSRGFYCQVADFGMRRIGPAGGAAGASACGSARYCAPELLRDGLLTPAADVYSFGMLLWELLSGRKAYCTKSQRDMAADVVAGSRPPLPLHCPNDVAAVIRECWDPDRSRRPNAQALLERLARLAGAHAQTACYRIIEEEEEGAEDRQRADAGATSISANLHRPFARERSIALPPPRSREAASPKPPQTPQWQSRNGREDGTPQEKRIIPSPQEPKPAEDEAIPNDSLLQSKPQNEGQCGPQGPCKGGPLGPGGGVAQRLAGSGPQGLVVCGPQGPVGAGLQAPSRQGPRWVVATNVELTDLSSDSESEALSDSGQLTPRLDTATTSQIQCSVARSDAGIPTAINGTHSGGSQGA